MSNPCQETVQLVAAGPEKSVFFKGASLSISTILQAQKQLGSTKGTSYSFFVLVYVCAFFSLHFYFSDEHEVEGGWMNCGREDNMIKYNVWDFFTKERRKMIFKTLKMDRNILRDIQAHKTTPKGKGDTTMMGVR